MSTSPVPPAASSSPATARHEAPLAAVLVAVLSGALVAVQGIFNGAFTAAGGGPLIAGWVSYIGTLLAVILVFVIGGNAPNMWRILRHQSKWWWYCVGIGGVPIVISMSWGIPIVGIAITSVCSVAGQTIMSLILDRYGVGLPARIPLTTRRLLAAGIALVGVSLAITSGTSDADLIIAIAACVLVFLSGAILTAQSAGNGAVVAHIGNPLMATLTSSIGGTILISLIAGGSWIVGGLDGYGFPGSSNWWMYLGGPVGAGITFCAAWAVRRLGTFRLTLAVVAGQMVTALVVDAFSGIGLSPITVASAIIMVLATLLVAQQPTQRKS